MFNNDNRVVYYAMAGMGILVSAATIYYLVNNADDSEMGSEFK